MLVLTRKSNQSIMIGDEIEITVLSIGRDKVRLGIDAPRTIPVFRTEVHARILAERGEGRFRPDAARAPGTSTSAAG